MSTLTSRQVESKAGKGQQLTLGDLRAFIQVLDDAGAANSTPIGGRVSPRGKLTEIRANAVRLGDRV